MVTKDRLLTAKEAAKLLGVARCTLYRWIKREWIVGIFLPNGTIRIPQAVIDSMLARKR